MAKEIRWALYFFGLLLLALSFSPPLPGQAPRLVRETWQFGHILLFFCWFYLLLPRLAGHIKTGWVLLVTVIATGLISGLAIEGLQLLAGRDFSLQDMIFNLVGVLIALSLYSLQETPGCLRPMRYGLVVTSTLICLYVLLPFSLVLADEVMLHTRFPRLADFDSRLELSRWQGNVSLASLDSPQGKKSVMRVDLETGGDSGAYLNWLKRDWRGFDTLGFELYVPGNQGLAVTLRIHDVGHFSENGGDYHDRYNKSLHLEPGWNHVSIGLDEIRNAPQTRSMDMASIQEIALFNLNLPAPRSFFIDSMRLE